MLHDWINYVTPKESNSKYTSPYPGFMKPLKHLLPLHILLSRQTISIFQMTKSSFYETLSTRVRLALAVLIFISSINLLFSRFGFGSWTSTEDRQSKLLLELNLMYTFVNKIRWINFILLKTSKYDYHINISSLLHNIYFLHPIKTNSYIVQYFTSCWN